MAELWELSASEAGQHISNGQITSRDLLEALLDRVERLNPRVNAVVEPLADTARRQADAADRDIQRGVWHGPLHGVPITVKTNLDVAGSSRSNGVVALADQVAETHSPEIARLCDQGAIVFARTNMPDFGPRWHTDNALHGPTMNPWHPDLTVGGSSGGEAAAIATGMSPLGIGTDSGGSLRVPAQFCGVSSLRPSLGRIPSATAFAPEDPPIAMQLMNVSGPMARTADDLELALKMMAGPHPKDPWAAPVQLSASETMPRVAVTFSAGGGPIDTSVADGIRTAADALSDAGFDVHEAEPPEIAQTAQTWRDLMMTELSQTLLPVMKHISSPGAVRFIELSLEAFPPVEFTSFINGFVERSRLNRAWAAFQQEWPLILGPVGTTQSMEVGQDIRDVQSVAQIYESVRFVVAANGLGLPAVVTPVGLRNQVPHAVQIVGKRYGELDCLAAAREIENRVEPVTPHTPVAL